MPQIPISTGPSVRDAPLQGGFQRTPDTTAGLRALSSGLGATAEVVDAAVRREVETDANRVDTEITAGWLKWDAENRNKFQGQNAAEYQTQAQAWWDKARETYGKGLNPLAQRHVGPALARKQTQAMGAVQNHVATEKERHADAQAEAAAQQSIEFGVDTGDSAGAADRVRQIAAEKGARKGWTTELVQADQQRHLGTLHLATINKLSATDPAKARAYYEANKGEIPAPVQARVEEVLKGETDNLAASQFAASVATKPLSEQLSDAAKITDPQRREKTLNQIRNNHAMVDAANREREAGASDKAWQLVAQGKRVPEAVLSAMDGRGRAQLQEHVADRARLAAAREAPKTDWQTYIDVRERLAAGEAVDLRPLTTKIAPAQMEQLLDIKTRAASTGNGGKQDSMLTDEARMKAALVGLGIDQKKSPADAGAFIGEVDRRVRAASAAKGGKDVTADEKQTIVDAVSLDKVYVSEWGTDPQKPVALLKPEELAQAYVTVNGREVKVSTVPAEDRADIIRERKARRLPVTEQSIVETYLRAHSGQRATGKAQ